ncbi:MAG TPA: malto-oligosyltrehalose trehalohydrolase [Solirubrobacteraceae bacterium]|jgi:maltooligosyltrehalose trehalohydrolase|nr:malto-oligosyltrehalose trehalohydrolase [Solirubrobacteraceae bacterium]
MTLPFRAALGASPRSSGEARAPAQTLFRVWAPLAQDGRVWVVDQGGERFELADEGYGVFCAEAPIGPGEDYGFALADGAAPLADPCSRHQPDGLRGLSRVLDPTAFGWSDDGWVIPPLAEQVIYELHVGAFTPQGTFAAAAEHLGELAELGIRAVELMPVADFPGVRGWGYDGVYISAAHRAYGGPEGLAAFVDAAHGAGVAVILDVVYNHVGASGSAALEAFGPYLTEKYQTFWGKAVNYDDAECDAVREWVAQSATGWVRDFHIDGLRLDAIHAFHDSSPTHIVAEIAERVHTARPGAIVIAESGFNDARVIRPREVGGWGCDAQWADDFHHSLHALLTHDHDGYYEDYGRVADLAKAYHRPFVYDGQWSGSRRRSFGAPAEDRRPEQFVVFDQNHDQVGNRARGDRLAAAVQPLAAFCTLLSPFVPLLFMGEEYGERAPFQFFTDHIDPDIAEATREGRREEFAEFEGFEGQVPDPQSPATFERSKLRRAGSPVVAELYRELLAARRGLSGEAEVSFDESARWLRARREGGEIVCNFSAAPLLVEIEAGRRLVLATDRDTRLEPDSCTLRMTPMSGALIA